MKTAPRLGSRAFTILEIMIVGAIVVILSWLALIVIGRVRDRTIQSMLNHNLRQLYQAKEYYFAETGHVGPVTAPTLRKEGYLRASVYQQLFEQGAIETKAGWQYSDVYLEGEPTLAYRGTKPLPSGPVTADVQYYPAPPTSNNLQPDNSLGGSQTGGPDASTGTNTPPVSVPVTKPDPGTNTGTGNANGGATGNPAANNQGNGTGNGNTKPPGNASGTGPGNSNFGHSHNPNNHGHHP